MIRKLFITSAVVVSGFLSGCGFTPLHGGTGAAAPLANVDVQLERGSDVVDNQAGFFVLQRLRDRIGEPAQASPYVVQITPKYQRRRLGLTNADVASRYDIVVRADWVLLDSKTGNRLDKGIASSIVTFGAPAGPYGVITADSVGVEQAAKETADKLVIDLAEYFAAEKKKANP